MSNILNIYCWVIQLATENDIHQSCHSSVCQRTLPGVTGVSVQCLRSLTCQQILIPFQIPEEESTHQIMYTLGRIKFLLVNRVTEVLWPLCLKAFKSLHFKSFFCSHCLGGCLVLFKSSSCDYTVAFISSFWLCI